MDMLLGLVSLAALSLFLAHVLRRSASLMPLVAVCLAMLWFTLLGALGVLQLAGWLWYAGCAAALGFVLYKRRRAVWQLATPGFWLFLGVGAGFILVFALTQPLLTQWDEFVVWGTAAKTVFEQNALYTLQAGNLFANVQPPGLSVLSYMMQFFGASFAEYKLMAALAVLYTAAFAAATTLWDKKPPAAIVMMGSFLLLPFLLEWSGVGVTSWAYLSAMADTPLAVLFGGALCLYYGGGEKDEKLLLLLAVVLAALVNIKDMGFAFACLALFIAGIDLIFCERERLSFFGLKRWKGLGAVFVAGLAAVGITYGGWAWHLGHAAHVDRGNVGSGGAQLTQMQMLLAGVKALFGIAPDAVFDDRMQKMQQAFMSRRVWLFGGGWLAAGAGLLLLIAGILILAWVLNPSRRERRQTLAFALTSAFGFAAYSVFITFTYTYVFSELEGSVLAEYSRYLYPYWFTWLMVSLLLLARAAFGQKEALPKETTAAEISGWKRLVRLRGAAARVVCLVLCAALFLVVAVQGNWQADFMRVSPSLYGERLDVQAVVETARNEGMQDDDVVYLISQGDDAGRFYLFAYELEAKLALQYGGEGAQHGTQAATLAEPGVSHSAYLFWQECTPEQLSAYLAEQGCTHILLDVSDYYILEAFGPMFSDGLSGWTDDNSYAGGRRYYAIEWDGGEARFVPVESGVSPHA